MFVHVPQVVHQPRAPRTTIGSYGAGANSRGRRAGGLTRAPAIVQLRSGSGPLLQSQRFSAASLVDVTLDRGEAHGEGAGRPVLGHPAFYGGDYPGPQVFRLTAHGSTFSSARYLCNML